MNDTCNVTKKGMHQNNQQSKYTHYTIDQIDFSAMTKLHNKTYK